MSCESLLDAYSSHVEDISGILGYIAKVAAAMGELSAASRDVLEVVGLVGTSLPTMDGALAAVVTGEPAAAQAEADGLEAALVTAREAGTQRLAVAGVAILLLVTLVAVAFFVRRRRARRAVPVAVAAESATGVTPPDA